ncbi:MAG TPA: tripartite tricarboxylate transporter permease [Xanthomonadales bacterium]|nr:tripartite tricarboxylate transporter permease [Xanthomonadales bacterium]
MDSMVLEAALESLALVLSWPYILYPLAGTLLAMVFSATPGLNSSSLMALAIPVTYAWDPLAVMLLFGAFVGGATFMGSVTAILFNIPGKAQNAVTLLDGYPMTEQGQAKTAIGCAAASSALGSTLGIFILVALIPLMRQAAIALGPAEYLMLAIWGLTMLAALVGNSVIKGLAAAGMGLALAMVGYDPRTAEQRFTFGLEYLHDGLSLVPVFLGLFALAEVIDLVASGRETLSGRLRVQHMGGSVTEGVRSVFRHFGLFLRSSVIGTVIGAIPGIGSAVAGFIAYGHASQTARDRSRFGHGDIRGVLAPEAAMDAKDGGALIPTLALGIPGGTGTAVLLGALTLHGLTPGRELLTENLVLVFALIWSLFLSNWITSLLGLALVNPMARLSTIRTSRMVPIILAMAVLGAVQYRGQIADAACAVFFGLLGYLMKRLDWSRIPLVIALALAPLFETNLHLTLRLQELGRIDFWSRPVVIGLLLLTIGNLFLPALVGRLRSYRGGRRQ